jgi:hypothetical protein
MAVAFKISLRKALSYSKFERNIPIILLYVATLLSKSQILEIHAPMFIKSECSLKIGPAFLLSEPGGSPLRCRLRHGCRRTVARLDGKVTHNKTDSFLCIREGPSEKKRLQTLVMALRISLSEFIERFDCTFEYFSEFFCGSGVRLSQ